MSDTVCVECGATENIEEHHISYRPPVKKFLCFECHKKLKPGKGKSRRCPECDWSMNALWVRHLKTMKKVGYICKLCKHIELDEEAEIFQRS